ncbi:probable transcription factor At5g61620 [Sesamum indicum]|uniref:Probable transcription factor At5g61620 n=1 Tax=Sesamum indicum TaxID=4182 RepID=A0A6I9SZV4_SESIN|nr:probable transcription factor At5g61620 [Sesamum indicum]
MPNECGRKCSHCGHNGHNSRTCSKGCTGFKLFGVKIAVSAADNSGDSSIRKSKSLGNLQACNPENATGEGSGYLSDGLVNQSSKSHERKKGKPWSEDEHRSFLVGLEKLGKGDWKGIASNFVPSRNSSQVASHAQKYFIRMAATERKRRRASVFDIPLNNHTNRPSQVTLGSQSNRPPEQGSHIAVNTSKKTGEVKGQASMVAPGATSERPPLSPMKRRGIPDFCNVLYTPRVSSFAQGFPAQVVVPTVSWVPVVNFSSQSSNVYLSNGRGALPTCGTNLVPQPASMAALRQLQPSQAAGAAAPTSHKDELNLNIRKLTL